MQATWTKVLNKCLPSSLLESLSGFAQPHLKVHFAPEQHDSADKRIESRPQRRITESHTPTFDKVITNGHEAIHRAAKKVVVIEIA